MFNSPFMTLNATLFLQMLHTLDCLSTEQNIATLTTELSQCFKIILHSRFSIEFVLKFRCL